MVNMIEVVENIFPDGCTFILSHTLPEFGTYFKVLKIMNMLDVCWQRAGHPPYDNVGF